MEKKGEEAPSKPVTSIMVVRPRMGLVGRAAINT